MCKVQIFVVVGPLENVDGSAGAGLQDHNVVCKGVPRKSVVAASRAVEGTAPERGEAPAREDEETARLGLAYQGG